MVPLLDLAATALLWSASFIVLNRTGTWLPITVSAVLLAASFLVRFPSLRRQTTVTPANLGLGLLAAAAMIAVTYAGYRWAVQAYPSLGFATSTLYGLLGAKRTPRPLLVGLLLATTLGEEVIFRGRLVAAVEGGRGGSWASWGLSALCYAGFHLASGNLFLICIAFLCALYWGALQRLSGSLVPSMVCHALWDLAILVVQPLA